jgi:mannose-6-phosphate isomerase-like protein (cupin superfamily)
MEFRAKMKCAAIIFFLCGFVNCETLAQYRTTRAADDVPTSVERSGVISEAHLQAVGESFVMNAGLNDAWFNPLTDGQGFFITVFPELGVVTLAWFTYDTELPEEGASANLGDPGHRWMTALGTIDGNQSDMTISVATGGLFDTATDIDRADDGTITLTFNDCTSGTIDYDITSINQHGSIPIQRVANSNIALCEALEPTFFEVAEIDDLSTQLTDGYVMAFEKPSMSVAFIELFATQVSGRPQSTSDEVFFVFEGSGKLMIGDAEQTLSKGDAVIVEGNFESKITTNSSIQVVVASVNESGFTAAGGFKHYLASEISSMKTAGSNSWNPFLQQSNVLFGMYSLPQAIGGDQSLTHSWDELNIVTSGGSRFSVGDQTIDVKRGSIVFLDKGNGHFFDQLSADIDIMILWEQ